ncbi:MAG: N-acetylneuraminate synthase [Candidatus Magasanikbacteria bacterium RIFCSPHIGHO2_02_FULL_51_14]|uniref:N-acetylneuraminate synthase n=1 Tax=Candidatus Magasanikbacteria bacterium RIFCSPHIGHO2_02_FULL_51_14 TaxID=1798683 RepID=A0A1F6MDB9_9BACT|nr:MAG: N-acetylneuraminate synthase [Candidatus Magasanikbacteria bacterium RIFCSPHIGHO2_02_FULL_51_14]
MPVTIIAEVGINHNGDLDIAKRLIDGARLAGCDAVKFQKRTIETVYTKDELDRPRESPWGTTNRQQKDGLEFSLDDYREIDRHCKERGMKWFFSAWDPQSQRDMRSFGCPYNKIASAMIGHTELLREVASEKKHTFLSTGMSAFEEIDRAVEVFRSAGCPFELMHCNSTYPMQNNQANLKMIQVLRDRYHCNVGYSGHEQGRVVSFAACVLGATSLERHITLDRGMYGSDQAASIEIYELCKLVNDVRIIDAIMGDGVKRVTETEQPIREKLRYYDKKK